jgi:hypothetical protein
VPPPILRAVTFVATQDSLRGDSTHRTRKNWRTTRPLHASRSRARIATRTTALPPASDTLTELTRVPSVRVKPARQLAYGANRRRRFGENFAHAVENRR